MRGRGSREWLLRRPRTPPSVRDRLAQKLQQRALLFRETDADNRGTFVVLAKHLEGLAVHVFVEQAGADVGRAADGGGVAELLGGGLNGALDLLLAFGLARGLVFHAVGDRAAE